ncbi:hypothetical protein [Candidatus Halobonum tyrrellensis]|uniref:Uncharacterized protein n=1 Tax=Candidatus Halobonum tyrrellensis G22 TaxID=1324957 RepID=V4GUD2_9EURY|nr:hypothetical protein [Candidatus Halobonum tyrrellensis]ESP88746.1 hypothetical protein K933_07843 [Candidatus Halobonum tyrrellensis G22]
MTATHSAQRIGLFALHQTTVLLGILLFPLALATHRVGLSLPMGGAVERVRRAYADATNAGDSDAADR